MQYNCVGGTPSVNLVFDMTDAAAGITDGTGPRKINVLGMRLESNNTSVELKGGLWNFNTSVQYPPWNVVYCGASNAVLTLSSGAVVTNIAAGGYNHFTGAKMSAIRLAGGSKWYGKSALWPFKGGFGNRFQVSDGSYAYASELDFGRLDQAAVGMSHNYVEVIGAGSKLQIGGTAFVGGPNSNGGVSNGNELHVTDQANMTVAASTVVGAGGSFSNFLLIGDKATYNVNNAQALVVGGQAGSSNNVVRVEGSASLEAKKITVGRGANGNSLLVDNASVRGTELWVGDLYGNVRGCSNLVRVVGAKSTFKLTTANSFVFGRGDFNTFEVDGANLTLGTSVEFSYSDNTNQHKNRGNTVRLKNGAVLTTVNFRLGSSTDKGENMLDISGGSRLSASWLMAYSNDVVRIKIPANGYSVPAISVQTYLTFKDTTVLDIDASDWNDGPRTCELMRSQYGSSTQIAFNKKMLAATNDRLAGRYVVSVTKDGKALQIRRMTGLNMVVR